MIVSTPYIECYVKRSFLSGSPVYGKDETEFGILIGIRFVKNRAPLYIVYFPEIGATYDKVDQCAIFEYESTPELEITNQDVAWWDCISDKWQLMQFSFFKNFEVNMQNRSGKFMSGKYLFTCDPLPQDGVDYSQAEIWHEHKTKTYFFDYETGVLCCCPNNKMLITDSSLSPKELKSPDFLRVYKDSDAPDRISHETDDRFGSSDKFNYKNE